MKILHSADWHIGKMLYKQSIREEFMHFIEWLFNFIKAEKIDVLLVSGDIFDYANPSHQDVELYYKILNDLMKLKIKVVITGGNHDSPALLSGPKSLLKNMDIFVFGSLSNNLAEHVLEFKSPSGVSVNVLAIPFIREKDIRKARSMDGEEKTTDAAGAIQKIYDEACTFVQKGKKKPFIIAMGHLHLFGSNTSNSEREVHVGNLLGIPAVIFNEAIDYVGLGHIHKPQKISGNQPIYYSGSPIFLDFSEREYLKQVIIIEVNELHKATLIKKEIPVFRKVVKLSGSVFHIRETLQNFKAQDNILPDFIEIEVITGENVFEDKKILLNILASYENDPRFIILKSKMTSPTVMIPGDRMTNQDLTIEEMSPIDVFRQLMQVKGVSEERRNRLELAYMELFEDQLNEKI